MTAPVACVEIKVQAPHAVDAILCLLDGVVAVLPNEVCIYDKLLNDIQPVRPHLPDVLELRRRRLHGSSW